jgi:hypothetical protein
MNLQVNKFITLPGLSRAIYKIKEWVESRKMINITYSELKVLRDGNKLIPGQQYRITDYITTTSQENTQSAGHQFDIIVTADSENSLNEKARAIQHKGDTYFSNSNFDAWEIWYSIDNDTERFAWADVENGKGVIYRMIDEFNNDCPYDFKNIQFLRVKGASTHEKLIGKTEISDYIYCPIEENFSETQNPSCIESMDLSNPDYDSKYFYTFNGYSEDIDISLSGKVKLNTILSFKPDDSAYRLNNIIFRCDGHIYDQKIDYDCFNITFIGLNKETYLFKNSMGQYSRANIIIAANTLSQNNFNDNCQGNCFIGSIIAKNDIL